MNNILILSAGTRNKLVQYMRENLKDGSKLIAADISPEAPALYEADKYYLIPRIDDSSYIDSIKDICYKEKIGMIISLIDPELDILSKNRKVFEDIGCQLMLSSKESIDISFDKYRFYEELTRYGIKTPKTYKDLDVFKLDLANKNISFPIFVKPRKGSASINISRVDDLEELEFLFKTIDDLIIQEYMDGYEYGIDAYIDMESGKLVDLFTKKKLKMRAGETDKSISIHDEKLANLVEKLVNTFNFRGTIDIDAFYKDGEYYVSEINPRFGGGYPHAYECGVNFPEYIMKNMQGKSNEVLKYPNFEKDVVMMKYNDLMIRKING